MSQPKTKTSLLYQLFVGPDPVELDESDPTIVKADAKFAELKNSMTAEQWEEYKADWCARHLGK